MNKFNILNDGLIINKISKSFGNKKIIKDISINIKKGEIVGLLGPNGAGKTTTFYIIVGLIKPDNGSKNISTSTHAVMAKIANNWFTEIVSSRIKKAKHRAIIGFRKNR